jgi:hypothetical protein
MHKLVCVQNALKKMCARLEQSKKLMNETRQILEIKPMTFCSLSYRHLLRKFGLFDLKTMENTIRFICKIKNILRENMHIYQFNVKIEYDKKE